MKKEGTEKAARIIAKKLGYNNDFEIGFKKGALWRINSIWHKVNIEPLKNHLLIVENEYGAYELIYHIGDIIDTWQKRVKKEGYIRYAYVRDLIPIKED